MPWVTIPTDGWKDHPDSPHLTDQKPKIGDSKARKPSGIVGADEPDTFWSGVLKSITSGDALSAGVQGLLGYTRGALADLPESIAKGAYGTGKTISGLLQGDPETYKGMYQGTKDLANQVIDTTTHAGGRPQEFGRMMGQMTGQPLVTEGIARGGAINPARFEAPIPESVGALPESTLPVIDVPPSDYSMDGIHSQSQLARIGNPEPIPTQFDIANPESIPADADVVNNSFKQFLNDEVGSVGPQDKLDAIRANQAQMQQTIPPTPVDPAQLSELDNRINEATQQVRGLRHSEDPNIEQPRQLLKQLQDERSRLTNVSPEEEIANANWQRLHELDRTMNEMWWGTTYNSPERLRLTDLLRQTGERIGNYDHNAALSEIRTPSPDVMPESDVPTEAELQVQEREDPYIEDEHTPALDDIISRGNTSTPNQSRWQVVDMHDPENPIAEYSTEQEAMDHVTNNPTEPYGYREFYGPQTTSRIPADIEEIQTATTSDELNRLYREWNEEYHQARASSNSAMEEHARNMSVLIDERLTNEFNQPESLGSGSPNPPDTPQSRIQARQAAVNAFQQQQTPTAPQIDLGQLYHVYDQADGSVIATFNTRYQAMNFVDEPGNEHLDIAVRGEVPPATGVRKKTLTELREATGVPNPPIQFGKQDLSIVTDLTDAQLARLRGGAGRDARIDKKGRKDPKDRQVTDTGYDDMAKRALARTPDGDPGLTITDHSYGGSHKRYEIVFRGADGKAQALATVEETPEGWRKVPWLMADRTKGGKPAMYVMSAIAKMNATEQSGSISNHTANVIAQLTQRSDKLTARASRKAARLKREGSTETPPPED